MKILIFTKIYAANSLFVVKIILLDEYLVLISYKIPSFIGTVMQTEKTLINDRLRVSKASWKFRIPIVNNVIVM